MSHFKILIYGESNLSHDEIGERLCKVAECIEKEVNAEVSLSYSPTDEQGDEIVQKADEVNMLMDGWQTENYLKRCKAPIDDHSESAKESIPIEFIMQYVESHGLYTSAMEVIPAWREEKEA